MQNSWYSFDVSPLWVIVALISAAGLAIFVYTKPNTPWNRSQNFLLGFLRFASIFLIILLFLNPLLQFFINSPEEPIVILAIDDSASIRMRENGPSTSAIDSLIKKAEDQLNQQYEVRRMTLSGVSSDSISFEGRTTNLSAFIKDIENIYSDQNLGAIVLVSDGIVNQGQSPEFQHFKFPIYTIGVGDTIEPKDIAIQNIQSNKIAYQGNKFPVRITINQKGYEGLHDKVIISQGGEIIEEKPIAFEKGNMDLDFLVEANGVGLKRYTASISGQPTESTTSNNRRDFYINIIEGKEKILILAPAPHPDISAIRKALDVNSSYETTLYIPGIHQPPAIKKYDVIIEHNAFSGVNYGNFESQGKWCILGTRTNYRKFSENISIMGINVRNQKKDRVNPLYDKNFSKFKLDEELIPRLKQYPPLYVPFGDYQLSDICETLLFQKIGSVETDHPLMTFYDEGSNKMAITIGDGLWQWRMQESGSEGDSRLFDELIKKTVQLLSIKQNQDRFIVKPRKNDYLVGQKVMMDVEVYSDILERVYENIISLKVTSEDGKTIQQELIDNPSNTTFNLGSLPSGLYSYLAEATLGDNTFTEKGSFLVKDIQIEQVNLTANHRMLQNLSADNKGEFVPFSNSALILNQLTNNSFQPVIHTKEEIIPLINKYWIVLIIALLLAAEWFLRKYFGAY